MLLDTDKTLPVLAESPAPSLQEAQEDIKAPVLTHADAEILLHTVSAAIQHRETSLQREQAAVEQTQKALKRLKRSTSQQLKQAEIEKMQGRLLNWQREIEQLERVRERLLRHGNS